MELEENYFDGSIEYAFLEHCKANNIKFDSKLFYKEQLTFFKGVLLTLDYLKINCKSVTKWNICIISSRPIITY